MTQEDIAAEWNQAAVRERIKSIGLEERLAKCAAALLEQRDESIKSRLCRLEKRIKHLEAVICAEGPDVKREDCVP